MKKELETTYDPGAIEERLYQKWLDNKYFHAEVDETKQPYTIVIPPPNITGKLHMGHALDETLQDILIRFKKMQGYNALWIPGTDHASIATEVKIINALKEEGIEKEDLGREKFLERAWDWKEEYGGTIIEQMKKLGSSCDWDRERFTMDEGCSEAVKEVFIKLYEKGYIYKGSRIINWCPVCQTSISDAEVEHEEQDGFFWHINYPIVGEEGRFVEIATTRPETLLGDTAVAVNPEDERYKDIVGKMLKLPLTDREIPVIADEYVDKEFGTGCVKITPAHDPNDFEVGKRHNLEEICIMNDDATISVPGKYQGMDRYEARKAMVEDLKKMGLLVKVVPHSHNVGTHDRCGTTVEPMVKPQWFVKMEEMAKPAVEALKSGRLKFVPESFGKTYLHWLEGIRDWCISRQLWWGHQIPAWYDEAGRVYVARTEEEAQKQAGEGVKLTRDEDVLDTWFSSALVPFSTLGWPHPEGDEKTAYDLYLPSTVLVTGYDILFFWVARMIMAGYEYEGQMPFKNVYFTGIVRDKLGRKMSKSLGNSPDPLELIDKYGADGVRMGMMLSAPAGNDILFDDALCEQGRNFCNKIWNAFRLIKGWTNAEGSIPVPEDAHLAVQWFEQRLDAASVEMADLFSKYRLSEALMLVYKLFWDEFSSYLLEIVKPAYGQPINGFIYSMVINCFERLLELLHPFMPFITEELWQQLRQREPGASLMVTRLSETFEVNEKFLQEFEVAKEIISNIRSIRLQKNIAMKEQLRLQVIGNHPVEKLNSVIMKMCNLSSIMVVYNKAEGAASFMIGTTEFAVPLIDMLDIDAEINRLLAELKHKESFLQGIVKKLSNEKFVNNAPAAVIELERKKQADAESIIKSLKESLTILLKR